MQSHVQKTNPPRTRKRKVRKHGVYSTYVSGKCRCDACRKSNKKYHDAYRKANPDSNSLNLKKVRAEKVSRGECCHCPAQAYPGYRLCMSCAYKQYLSLRKRKQRGGEPRTFAEFTEARQVLAKKRLEREE